MTSLKKKLERNKRRLSRKNGAILGRQLPAGVRLDLPALGKYLNTTEKTFEELTEAEIQQFVW